MMDSGLNTQRMMYWLLFALIAGVDLILRLLPIETSSARWPVPDFILVLGFAWVLRRPSFVPTILFAVIIFGYDLLLLRAPGLFTALAIIALEFLRGRSRFSRELTFIFEWALVAGVLMTLTVSNRLLLGLFAVPQPDLALDTILLLGNIAIYPILVIVSAKLFGVRKVAPGAIDQLGHQI